MPGRLPNRKILAAAAALLLTAALVFFHFRTHRESLDQLSRRQQTLTIQAASAMEEDLRTAQATLRFLARDASTLLDPTSAPNRLDHIVHAFSPRTVLAAYVKNAAGELVAEYPPRQMERAGLPPESLSASPDRSPELIHLERSTVLRLSHPLLSGRGEVGVLIVLDRLRDNCLRPLREVCSFQFLLDENGLFVLSDDPDLAGKRLDETTARGIDPAYGAFLSAAIRDEHATSSYYGTLAPKGGERVLVTCAPLRVAGAQWSLGLAMPPSMIAPIDRSSTLFASAFAGLLLLSAVVARPTARLLSYPRQLHREQQSRREETAGLLSALEQSRQRAQQLLEHAGDAVFFLDPSTGTLLEGNRRVEDLLGYRPEELRTLSLVVLFPGREHRRYLRLVKRVLRHGYGEERRLLFRAKDGRQFIGEVHARLGELGERPVVHGILRDVTEMHRIETELRRKNRDLTLLNEIAHHCSGNRHQEEMLYPALHKIVQAFGAEGGGIYLAREEGGDLTLAAHQGVPDDLLLELQLLPRGEGLVGRVFTSGHPQTAADVVSDGRIWSESARRSGWKGIQAVPLTANEKTIGVLFLFSVSRPVLGREDLHLLMTIGRQIGTAVEGARLFAALQRQVKLTQASNQDLEHSRRQLRDNLADLEEANRAMAQLDRMKSNFLTLASHELRTPLTYILSGTELLADILKGRLTSDEERTLEVINQGGQRLKEIVEDLLEAARIESQNLYLAREKVDLAALISELCQECRSTLTERRLTVHCEAFPSLLSLTGDIHHLKKTFRRLIENAIKFTPGGGRIQIRGIVRSTADLYRQSHQLQPFSPIFFASALSGQYLQVTVEDSGVGIDPRDQVRIFDKFYEIGDVNGHSTSRTRFGGKGVGLGLTLVKGMVEAHGGMVWVESAGDGGGSAFHVLLPLGAGREDCGGHG